MGALARLGRAGGPRRRSTRWRTRCCCRRCSSRAACPCSRPWRPDARWSPADRYGTKELAEGAAMLVDPESVESIAAASAGAGRSEPAARLIAAGRERSQAFQWSRCARETLDVLERVQAESSPPAPGRGSSAPPRPPRRPSLDDLFCRASCFAPVRHTRPGGQRPASRRAAHRDRSVHGAAAGGAVADRAGLHYRSVMGAARSRICPSFAKWCRSGVRS